MNIIRTFIVIVVLLFSFNSQADDNDECEVRPNSGFEFTVNINKYKPNKKYALLIEVDDEYWDQYDIDEVLLWSNRQNKDKDISDPTFLDTSLVKDENYELGFKYQQISSTGDVVYGELTYYRKLEGEGWNKVGTKALSLTRDKSDVEIKVKGKNRAEINCNGTVSGITKSLPDICRYVPGTLQTNYYAAGGPYGNLFISGEDTEIFLPEDNYEMSFFSLSATYDACLYPSSTDKEACKVSPYPIAGYPLTLTDNFSGDNLTIPAGGSQTLNSGEYWFDTITFGGDAATLNISGEVVLHYKAFIVPQTGDSTAIHINDGGDSKELLVIGHGTAANITTTNGSAAIIANAHFYIDNGSEQGISLGGNHSYIHGGISANSVSLSGRLNHINGNGGCGAPVEPPEPDIDVCEYFPGPVQGNHYGDNGLIDVPLIVKGGNSGGNRVYLDSTNPLAFSYADNTITDLNGGNPSSGCVYRGSDGSFPSTGETHGAELCIVDNQLDVFGGSAPQAESFDASGDELMVPDGGTLNISPGNYTSLSFASSNNSTAILSAGEYWIGELNFTQSSTFLKTAGDGQVIIHYNTINISGDRHYINADNTRSDNTLPDEVLANNPEFSPDNLILIGHGPDSGMTASGNDTYINAHWYISPQSSRGFYVNGNQRYQLIGSLSAPEVTITGGASYSYVYAIAPDGCSVPIPSSDYTLEVTPDYQFALLCEAPEVTFTVYNDDGTKATDYDGTITASFPEGLTPNAPTMGSYDDVYTPNQGVVKVPVESDSLGEFTVSAKLTNDTDQDDSGKILFGPYKFAATPDPIKAIASHPTPFDVKVLACKDDEVTPVKGYSGDKNLTISAPELTKPTEGQGAAVGKLEVSTKKDSSYSSTDITLEFDDDAKSKQAYLKYNESGSFNFTLTDPDFVCPSEYDGCEVTNDDGTEKITTLEGLVKVDVRPWTFAICDENGGNNLLKGNSDGGDKFIAAGDKFSLQVKPIVWQDGGSLIDDIDVSDYCNAAVTQNFLLTNAQPATVSMGSTLATPTQGHLGSGIQASEGGSLERAHDAVNSGEDHYTYTNLTWQEVGSLNITVDTNSDDYYGMDINQGYREIGRFYPHHLTLVGNDWYNTDECSSAHNTFAYMNQPTCMKYTIEARSADDNPTENYGYFDEETLLAQLDVVGVNINNNNMDFRDKRFNKGSNTEVGWSDEEPVSERNAQYVFTTKDFEFYKDSILNPYISTPDGPYDNSSSDWGVLVTDPTIDNVDFDFTGEDSSFKVDNTGDEVMAFTEQPDFRYGRMVLDSVSGPIKGTISVPLRVEYWHGDRFVTNVDDNASQFNTDVYLSDDENSSAFLTHAPNGKVDAGQSSLVWAGQGTASKETVRLFLRQGNTNNDGSTGNSISPTPETGKTYSDWNVDQSIGQPWLQFNWRDKGDEDPSTVVNFGAYRGNDRIIYRGEPNLTGE